MKSMVASVFSAVLLALSLANCAQNPVTGRTFADLARNSPLGRNAVSHLRLVNGMYPSGEPAARQSLKVIE